MKIAFLADGRSVHTVRWLKYFANKGFDVHLITTVAKPIKGVKIHELRCFRTRVAYPLRMWKIRKTVEEINPDVLHAHYITNYGVCAALSGFHPLVLSVWGDDIATNPEWSRIVKFFIKLALKKADLVHVGDKVGRKRLMELGCDSRKIFVQHWGVDTNRFSPDVRSELSRRSLGIDKVYSVVCARYWKPHYHVDVFVKAVPLVLKKMENVRFIMLGGGPLQPKLKELARKSGVYENIMFVGKIPEEEMPKYLANVDVYVDTACNYKRDIFGRVIVGRGGAGMGQTTRQAMACGTPHVLSDRIDVKYADWFQGLMYKQLDHRDLAEKIVQLLRDEKLRRKIGEKSRKVALEICDLEKTMNKWEILYHKLKGSGKLENIA